MSRSALFLGVCCLTRSLVLAQSDSPTTSAGDEFMVDFPFLAITGLGVLVTLFLVVNWVCFVVCICKSRNMKNEIERAHQARIDRERQFRNDLRAFVDNEVARKLRGKGMGRSGLQAAPQRPAHPDDHHVTVQGVPAASEEEEQFQLALKLSRQETRPLPQVDRSQQRHSQLMQVWPKDAPVKPLPRVHAGVSRQELIETPPRYSDLELTSSTSPWSFQGSPTNKGAALDQLSSWPQFV